MAVYANTTGKPYSSVEEIRRELCEQVCAPVMWETSILNMISKTNFSKIYECGPRDQLKAMVKRIDMPVRKFIIFCGGFFIYLFLAVL